MTKTRRAFHEELDELISDVVRLGALAGEAIEAGTTALLDSDLAAVKNVIAADAVLDELTDSIEERTYHMLALQQPMAIDLRTLVTGLRVIHELERIGDLMVRVAKATRRLYPRGLDPRTRGLIDRMREQAEAQLRLAMDAFADRDPDRAAALTDMDDVMDDLQKSLFQAIFAEHSNDEAAVQRAVQIALIGRYLERVGDHAANVGERVEFMVIGRFPRHDTEASTAAQ
ncbi:MAG: phosphate signaling complex protein PhoU [Actinomycetota bacterium]|nr:phosphate signaling complex protein PhoU [Actinomycetota bacterium]